MGHVIAMAGKGGVGKTTLCGLLIQYLCESGKKPVLAVDADANSNLNEVLGVEIGASGDTELFEKASNINGFQGGRVANNLYISPFRATVFQTAALFLYPNSSAVIGVENLRFLSL